MGFSFFMTCFRIEQRGVLLMLLRKRSRATSKQAALMADFSSLPSPTDEFRRPISSTLLSPRLFTGFASKGFSNPDTESVLSPTSTLDTKPFSALKTPFWSDLRTTKSPKTETKSLSICCSRGVGLGIVDELVSTTDEEMSDPKLNRPKSRMVLFGSHLKIQIPPSVLSPAESPKSPADFGIKTLKKSPFGSVNSVLENPNSPRIFAGCLSAKEMELSEDYTCVISHGPNPRTTHIFEDCIVESCCGVVGMSDARKENGFSGNRSMSYPSDSFLSFCYNCKKDLGHGKDIYMYRGEKAFCSSECRHKEMMLEEGMGKMESEDDGDDVLGAFL